MLKTLFRELAKLVICDQSDLENKYTLITFALSLTLSVLLAVPLPVNYLNCAHFVLWSKDVLSSNE